MQYAGSPLSHLLCCECQPFTKASLCQPHGLTPDVVAAVAATAPMPRPTDSASAAIDAAMNRGAADRTVARIVASPIRGYLLLGAEHLAIIGAGMRRRLE